MKLFISFLLVLLFNNVLATDISFVVYHIKGNAKKNTAKTVLVKGDKIMQSEMLVLGDKSSIMLICSNYKVIQIDKPGKYPIKNLLQLCDKNQASISSTYFKYVWDQFTHPHGEPDKNPEEYMKNVGAVSRGCNEVAFGIHIDTIYYQSGVLPLYWWASYKNSFASVYEQLLDGAAFKKMLLAKEKPLMLNDLFNTLKPGEFYWQIEGDEGSGCERSYVKILDKNSYEKIVQALIKTVPETTNAETAYLRAYVLEENHFIAEAIVYYQKAVKYNPENKIYKQSLDKFYEKNF